MNDLYIDLKVGESLFGRLSAKVQKNFLTSKGKIITPRLSATEISK